MSIHLMCKDKVPRLTPSPRSSHIGIPAMVKIIREGLRHDSSENRGDCNHWERASLPDSVLVFYRKKRKGAFYSSMRHF